MVAAPHKRIRIITAHEFTQLQKIDHRQHNCLTNIMVINPIILFTFEKKQSLCLESSAPTI
jgi:hypothetical protein